MLNDLFTQLETKIDLLVSRCDVLQRERISLFETEQHLMQERSRLIEKNQLVKSKVSTMIERLKTIDKDTGQD